MPAPSVTLQRLKKVGPKPAICRLLSPIRPLAGGEPRPARSDFKFIEMRNCTEQGVLAKPNLSAFGNFSWPGFT